MTELDVNHLLCFVIIAMILYYIMGSCGCGFRVGGQGEDGWVAPPPIGIINDGGINPVHPTTMSSKYGPGEAEYARILTKVQAISRGGSANEQRTLTFPQCCALRMSMDQYMTPDQVEFAFSTRPLGCPADTGVNKCFEYWNYWDSEADYTPSDLVTLGGQ